MPFQWLLFVRLIAVLMVIATHFAFLLAATIDVAGALVFLQIFLLIRYHGLEGDFALLGAEYAPVGPFSDFHRTL